MSCMKNELFVILWGLDGFFAFMAENTIMARIYLKYWIKKYNMTGTFCLYKIDKKELIEKNKKKLSYITTEYKINEEKLEALKEKIEKASIEKETKRQLEILFDGKEIKKC